MINDYTITELTHDRMVWVAVDNPSYYTEYVRVDSIPSDILPAQSE